MKKLLLAFLFISSICNAQNYQCLQSGVKHYFTNGNHYLRGIRIDSVHIAGSTTIYYPYRTTRNNLSDIGGSWLGKKVLQYTDGTTVFDNLLGDSVVIKTQANPGDTWTFYTDSARSFTATLTSIDTLTFLGITDSVKKITIHSFYHGAADAEMDGSSIILSKSNGFVKVFDLYTFPYFTPHGYFDIMFDFFLNHSTCFSIYPSCGYVPDTSNQEFTLAPYHDPTGLEVFDFNVGDVFIYDSFYNSWRGYDDIYMDSVVSKIHIDSGHIQYTFARGVRYTSYTLYCDSNVAHYSTPIPYSCCNTVTFTADTNKVFTLRHMPEEAWYDTLVLFNPNDATHCYQSTKYSLLDAPVMSVEPCGDSVTFKDGFLTLYGYGCFSGCPSSFPNSGNEGTNTYYTRKGGIACGGSEHIILSAASVTQPEPTLTIFPNPATTQLTIQSTNDINQLSITNLLGQTVYELTTPYPLLKTGGDVLRIYK